MKRTILFLVWWAAACGVISSTRGQTQTTTTTTSYVQSSAVIGSRIKDSQGEQVGVVKDIVLDRNTGCLAYAVVSVGQGQNVSTTKTVAAPWTVFSAGAEPHVLTMRVERERIYNAPVFDYAHVREYSTNPGYINQVYSYYGVSPSAGVGVGVSTGANTTTNTATTGYNANANTAAPPNANTAGSPATSASPYTGYSSEAARAASPGTSPATNASPNRFHM